MDKTTAILVLHRGWVAVGNPQLEGDMIVLENASVVRRWGTTKGLGEIAMGGPTARTKLDPAGTMRVHQLGVVAQFDCDTAKWEGKHG